ncbi:MAG: amino acid adenylation domain-containing protein [Halanaerobiales bacterium]|nr:amino acid adenylation domain-containing protein [Halanaerobiales bacterium]
MIYSPKKLKRSFWKDYQEGIESLPELPMLYSWEKNEVHNKDNDLELFYEDISLNVDDIASRYDLKPYVVLQGVWALLLSRYSYLKQIFFATFMVENPKDDLYSLLPVIYNVNEELDQKEYFQQIEQGFNKIHDAEFKFNTVLVVSLKNDILTKGKVKKIAADTGAFLVIGIEYVETLRIFAAAQGSVNQITAKSILTHFQQLLKSFMNSPTATIQELEIMSEEERGQILNKFNDTATDYPADKSIQEIFEEQVVRRGDKSAIIFKDQVMTYSELNDQANQLARVLLQTGVMPNQFVGLMLDRSPLMIVSILAILKAGGCYAPIDADYPQERIDYMLKCMEPSVVISQHLLLDKLKNYSSSIIDLSQLPESINIINKDNLNVITSSDDAAYINYTSGTTGNPKGIVVAHRGVVRLVKNTNYVNLTENDNFLQIAAITFDAATFEIWGALLNGGRLVIAEKERVLSVTSLAETIQKYNITSMFFTSTLFNQVVDSKPESLKSFTNLIVGGEALSLPHIKKALEVVPENTLVNGYGPTENTTFSCCHRFNSLPEGARSIPLGPPIANSSVYILDKEMRPVPIGVVGEIYLGGAGLAKGYWKQEENTKKAFIPNPFDEDNSSLLYKSGDLGRWMTNGMIDFQGRLDSQVKIRGFRIELAEIELVIKSHQDVLECEVVVYQDQINNKRMAVYYTAIKEVSVDEIRNFMRQKLPEYMIPSRIVQIEEFSVTPHGKIDRNALIDITENRNKEAVNEDRKLLKKEMSLEEKIKYIWQSVLGREVGLKDNFFDVGGDSLYLMQVQNQLSEKLDIDLAIAILFEYPSIEKLANHLEEGKKSLSILQQRVQRRLNIRKNAQKRRGRDD